MRKSRTDMQEACGFPYRFLAEKSDMDDIVPPLQTVTERKNFVNG